jgi:hypothetical protein
MIVDRSRRIYLRLAPTALAGLLSPPASRASRVVFVCTHNSARSQLAAALLARNRQCPLRRPAEVNALSPDDGPVV